MKESSARGYVCYSQGLCSIPVYRDMRPAKRRRLGLEFSQPQSDKSACEWEQKTCEKGRPQRASNAVQPYAAKIVHCSGVALMFSGPTAGLKLMNY